ncbi:hypothetical protein [Erythrobacter sp.]|jgi:hypothetical protein|uniref:hypothetical protein n=1 Tax=Erythrobacter sp. TaxID=1042 RepID=UPI002E9B0837|nr:hypothetical protein [Erythrobacter sp.]
MVQTFEFYKERAEEAAQRAEDATLENVKTRELRAQKSWMTLANQARRTVEAREKAEATRIAKREAEAAEAAASE